MDAELKEEETTKLLSGEECSKQSEYFIKASTIEVCLECLRDSKKAPMAGID